MTNNTKKIEIMGPLIENGGSIALRVPHGFVETHNLRDRLKEKFRFVLHIPEKKEGDSNGTNELESTTSN